MIEAAVIALRLLQYAAGSVLMGTALFALYALPGAGRMPNWRAMLAASALVLACTAALGLVAQTALLAGSLEAALSADALQAVVGGMSLGTAAVVRTAAAALALAALLAARPGHRLWAVIAILGAVAVASFAWMGHGAATAGPAGPWHLAADILHALAAAAWLGALAGFVALLFGRRAASLPMDVLDRALLRFSGLGPAVVAVLVLTGLVNGWILVGPGQALTLWETPYGLLLTAKLALFAAMLALAALNRLRLTGMLRADPSAAVGALRRSVAAETAAGLGVLFLVAWLGMLAPPATA